MKNVPKILITSILIGSIFSLSGCFSFGEEDSSGGDQPQVDEQSRLYETDVYSITIPKDWEVIDQKDFTSDVPEVTMIVFRNNVKNENFTANVNIVKNELQDPVATLEYAKLVNNRQKSGLVDYSESAKDLRNINIGGSDHETFFTSFEARVAANEKLIRYMQTYGVKDRNAYIVTGSFSPQESESTSQKVENIVKSFRLK